MANQDRPALLDDSLHAPLLQLWKKFLKTEDVSVDDDLFEKGGDSLMAIDLWLELQRLTGRQLPDSILFETSTIRALAKRLSSPVDTRERPSLAHPKFAGIRPSGE
jgi:oxalate---CoA ligase